MRFVYELNESGDKLGRAEPLGFTVEVEIDQDLFYIEKAEVFVHPLDCWMDCTDQFKARTTLFEKVQTYAAEDYYDAKNEGSWDSDELDESF